MLPKNFKAIHSINILKDAAKDTSGQIVDLFEIRYTTRMGNQGIARGLESDEQIKALREYNNKQPKFNQKQERTI